MSFSGRRISIVGAILFVMFAFFALQVAASQHGPIRADGTTAAPPTLAASVSTTPSAHTDGAIWG